MKQLDECYNVLADPYGYAKRLKATSGKKIIGTLCTYAPEEIIVAAGAHPLRLFGSGRKIRLAEAHLQSYCCSLVRGVLEDALAEDLSFLDGAVFPHTCDSIQRLSDLWRLNVGYGFHLDAVLPVKLQTESARDYLIDVLGRFREDLGKKLGKKISDDDLKAAIALYNRIRRALARIHGLAVDRPGILKGGDLHALTRAAMVMERARLADLLEEVVAEMEGMPERAGGTQGKRIILSGGLCTHPDIYSLIEEAGGVVVGDDLCTGSRYFTWFIDQNGEPIAALAERLRQRFVCPAKHAGLTNRADNLLGLVREKKARGVVFFLLKFCDPHAFDVPYLKAALDREGIPSIAIEVEDRLPADGQLRTRFEAFVEMI